MLDFDRCAFNIISLYSDVRECCSCISCFTGSDILGVEENELFRLRGMFVGLAVDFDRSLQRNEGGTVLLAAGNCWEPFFREERDDGERGKTAKSVRRAMGPEG